MPVLKLFFFLMTMITCAEPVPSCSVPYPKVFGGYSGDTLIKAMDYKSSTLMAGGSTSDPQLAASTQVALLIGIVNDIYAYSFYLAGISEISTVLLSENEQTALALSNTGVLLIIKPSDGTLLQAKHFGSLIHLAVISNTQIHIVPAKVSGQGYSIIQMTLGGVANWILNNNQPSQEPNLLAESSDDTLLIAVDYSSPSYTITLLDTSLGTQLASSLSITGLPAAGVILALFEQSASFIIAKDMTLLCKGITECIFVASSQYTLKSAKAISDDSLKFILTSSSSVFIGTLIFSTSQLSLVTVGLWGLTYQAGAFTTTYEIMGALQLTSSLEMATTGETVSLASSFKQVAFVTSETSSTCQQVTQTSGTTVNYSPTSALTSSSLGSDQFTTVGTTSITISDVLATTSLTSIVTTNLLFPSPDSFCSKSNLVLSTANVLPSQTFPYRASIAKSVQLNSFGEVTLCTPGGSDSVTYTVTMQDGSALPAYVTYTSAGLLTVDTTAPKINQICKVTGSLQNGQANTFLLTLSGVNNPPTFDTNPADQTVALAATGTYQLSSTSDYENNPMTIATYSTGTTTLPSWIAYDTATRTYTFTPTLYSTVGVTSITVNLSDAYSSTLFTFNVQVTNSAPIFQTSLTPQTFSYAVVGATYTLPAVSDNEILDYSIATTWDGASILPSIVSYSAGIFSFTPSVSDVGVHTVGITLSDGEPKSTPYTFTVTITNGIPNFSTPLVSQTTPLNNVPLTYTLPTYSDPDGSLVTLEATKSGQLTLPSFITLSGNDLIINPGISDFTLVGNHLLSVKLTDATGMQGEYTFTVTVTNSAPTFQAALVDQSIAMNIASSYQLPATTDPEGHVVFLTVCNADFSALTGFISFSGDTLSFAPPSFSDIGAHSLVVTVADGQPMRTNYTLQVTVINTAPYFATTPLPSGSVLLGESLTYSLPTITDDEFNTVTVTISSQPSYITAINGISSLTINPVLDSDIGTDVLTVVLSDGDKSSSYTFTLDIVDNIYPEFVVATLPSISMMVYSTSTYTLPSYSDFEGKPVTVAYEFGSLTATVGADQFTIQSPTFSEVGSHSIIVRLSDGFRITTYTIDVTVTNTAPYISALPLPDKTFQMNISETFSLPQVYDDEGNPVTLVPLSLPSFITYVSPFQFTAFATSFGQISTESVVFSLTDSHMSTTYSFLVTIFNTAPYFGTPLQASATVRFFNSYNLSLPSVVDDQNNPIIITVTSNLTIADSALLVVDQLSSTDWCLIIYPLKYDYVRTPTLVTLTLTDTNQLTTYDMLLIVFNDAPIFTNGVGLQSVTQKMNDNIHYQWPEYLDPEGDISSLSVQIVANDGTYALSETYITIDNLGIQISATLFAEVGTQYFTIAILDGEPKETRYSLCVTITNSAPYFLRNPSGKLGTVRVRLGEAAEWDLPPFKDDEGNPVFLEQQLPGGDFVTFNEMRYSFAPSTTQQIGTFKFTGVIKDGGELASPFSFQVIVFNEAPFFTKPIPLTIQAPLYREQFYLLPEVKDRESLPFTLLISSLTGWPSFVELQKNSTDYTLLMRPDQVSQIGEYQMLITLSDQAKATRIYQFKLQVKDLGALEAGLNENAALSSGKGKIQGVIRLGLRATQMNQEGVLKVRITNSQGLYVKNISEEYFKIRVVNKFDSVPFTIESFDSQGISIFRLDFEDIKQISNTIVSNSVSYAIQDMDTVELSVTETLFFSGNPQQNFTLQRGTSTSIQVPPQISKQQSFIAAKFKDSANIVSTAAVPGGLVINMTLSLFIQYLWSLLNDLSFLTTLTLISLTVPGIAQLIQSAMLSFIYLDILQTDKWLTPLILPDHDNGESTAINEQFRQNGFQDMMLISNLGSTFVYLVILILMMVAMLLAKAMSSFGRMKKIADWLQSKLVWNFTLRFFIQQFPPLMISSLINMYQFEYGEPGEALSTFLSIAIIASTQFITVALFVVLHKNRNNYKSKEFQDKYNTLFQGINQANATGRNWHPLVMMRWTFTSAIVVCFRDYYSIQIMALLLISILFQVILSLGQPLQSRSDNVISVFNEIMVSCYLYILVMLTEFNGVTTLERDDLGTLLVVTIVLSSVVNFMKFFYLLSIAISDKLKLRCQSKAKKKATEKEGPKYQHKPLSDVSILEVSDIPGDDQQVSRRSMGAYNIEEVKEHRFDTFEPYNLKQDRSSGRPPQVQSILERINMIGALNQTNNSQYTEDGNRQNVHEVRQFHPFNKEESSRGRQQVTQIPRIAMDSRFENFVHKAEQSRQQINKKYIDINSLQARNQQMMQQLESAMIKRQNDNQYY